MSGGLKAFLQKIFLYGASVLSIYAAALYLIQDRLLYHPDRFYDLPEGNLAVFSEISIKVQDGTDVLAWYAKGDVRQPAILFFHGNAAQVAKFAPWLLPFVERGYGVLMMEYRGFGKAQGKTDQKYFYADGLTAFDWLQKQGYKRIAVYGYSLGTSVATYVAANRPANQLILTAPFASMRRLVAEKPVPLARFVLRNGYESDYWIEKAKAPILIVHGKNDRLIPYHHAERLFKRAKVQDKTLKIVNGESHASIFLNGANVPVILNWLAER